MATQFITAPRDEWLALAARTGGVHGRLLADLIGDRRGDVTLKRVTTTRTEAWSVPTERELRRLAANEN